MVLTPPTLVNPSPPPQTRVEAGGRQFIVQATAPTLGLDNRPKVIPAMLENTRWELRRLDQTGVPAVPAAQQAYIRLSQGRVDGFTGCNLFNGDFKRELNNRLIFLVIRGSVKKCPGLEGQERELVRALQQVRNWQLTPDQQLLRPGRCWRSLRLSIPAPECSLPLPKHLGAAIFTGQAPRQDKQVVGQPVQILQAERGEAVLPRQRVHATFRPATYRPCDMG